jgi:hypothetical protein
MGTAIGQDSNVDVVVSIPTASVGDLSRPQASGTCPDRKRRGL